jgi:hypothetical protein
MKINIVAEQITGLESLLWIGLAYNFEILGIISHCVYDGFVIG